MRAARAPAPGRRPVRRALTERRVLAEPELAGEQREDRGEHGRPGDQRPFQRDHPRAPAVRHGYTCAPAASVRTIATDGHASAAASSRSSGPAPMTSATSPVSAKTVGATSTQSPWAAQASGVDGGDEGHAASFWGIGCGDCSSPRRRGSSRGRATASAATGTSPRLATAVNDRSPGSPSIVRRVGAGRASEPLQAHAVDVAPPARQRGGTRLAAEDRVRDGAALVRGELPVVAAGDVARGVDLRARRQLRERGGQPVVVRLHADRHEQLVELARTCRRPGAAPRAGRRRRRARSRARRAGPRRLRRAAGRRARRPARGAARARAGARSASMRTTSAPARVAVAATSWPISPAPSTARRVAGTQRARAARSASSSVRRVWTLACSCAPGRVRARLPVAMTSWSYAKRRAGGGRQAPGVRVEAGSRPRRGRARRPARRASADGRSARSPAACSPARNALESGGRS